MRDELQEKLVKKYPRLFKQVVDKLPATKSCMAWGICCEDGWFYLLDETCHYLELEYQQTPDEVKQEYYRENPYAFTLAQIKQKFGSLRVYLEKGTDKMYEIANRAEERSMHLCEVCGEAGVKRDKGSAYWIRKVCDAHQGYKPPTEEPKSVSFDHKEAFLEIANTAKLALIHLDDKPAIQASLSHITKIASEKWEEI